MATLQGNQDPEDGCLCKILDIMQFTVFHEDRTHLHNCLYMGPTYLHPSSESLASYGESVRFRELIGNKKHEVSGEMLE